MAILRGEQAAMVIRIIKLLAARAAARKGETMARVWATCRNCGGRRRIANLLGMADEGWGYCSAKCLGEHMKKLAVLRDQKGREA